jgi:DNA repair protein RecO
MAKEIVVTGFILKTQSLGEVDLLVTIFSAEFGKMRLLVKSVKKITSKLAGRLQAYNLLTIRIASQKQLPKVIGMDVLLTFDNLLSEQSKIHTLFVMQELINKALPDEQPNLELYLLYKQTLAVLDKTVLEDVIKVLLDFYIHALLYIGILPLSLLKDQRLKQKLYFSVQGGGFFPEAKFNLDEIIEWNLFELFQEVLISKGGKEIIKGGQDRLKLLALLNKFAEYQLERRLYALDFFVHGIIN